MKIELKGTTPAPPTVNTPSLYNKLLKKHLSKLAHHPLSIVTTR